MAQRVSQHKKTVESDLGDQALVAQTGMRDKAVKITVAQCGDFVINMSLNWQLV